MTENELATRIIGVCMDVHSALGPGLLENVYKQSAYFMIAKSGYKVEVEKPIPVVFQGVKLECGYRADILVENKLILEIKSIESLNDIHLAQVLTYLRLGNFKLGLLMNFNVVHLKSGIKRIANGI